MAHSPAGHPHLHLRDEKVLLRAEPDAVHGVAKLGGALVAVPLVVVLLELVLQHLGVELHLPQVDQALVGLRHDIRGREDTCRTRQT
jgi:hypothetical protein